MEYRLLGGSGFKVPVLSLGTGTFGGGNEFFKAWGASDVAEATKLIDICLDVPPAERSRGEQAPGSRKPVGRSPSSLGRRALGAAQLEGIFVSSSTAQAQWRATRAVGIVKRLRGGKAMLGRLVLLMDAYACRLIAHAANSISEVGVDFLSTRDCDKRSQDLRRDVGTDRKSVV